MFYLILLVVVIFAVLFVLKVLAEKKGSESVESDDNTPQQLNVVPVESILSDHELALYKQLAPQVPVSMKLLCKVRMEDVLRINVADFKERSRQRNKIKSRHFDFVLCDAGSFKPHCVIELDDSSHSHKSQIAGDALKDEACKVAQLPLFRIQQLKSIEPVVQFIQSHSNTTIN